MKCNQCSEKIRGIAYFWKGTWMRFCSSNCAAYGCPSGELRQENLQKKVK